jgi:hypothetical protein
MAKTPKAPEGTVKARVLLKCSFGEPNDVVEVDAEMAAASAGQLDASPEAVAYAESLK